MSKAIVHILLPESEAPVLLTVVSPTMMDVHVLNSSGMVDTVKEWKTTQQQVMEPGSQASVLIDEGHKLEIELHDGK